MWNWLTTRCRRSVGRRAHRPLTSLEILESRSLCAAQPVDAATWASCALDDAPGFVAPSSSDARALVSQATAAAVADDRFEQNDTISTATDLGAINGSLKLTQLVLADRADWYRFTISATGSSTSQASIDFKHANGDLDLALYNSRGSRLRRSDGVTGLEQVSLSGLAPGTYYAVVYGYGGATNPNYSFTVTAGAGGVTTTSGGTASGGSNSGGSNSGGSSSTGSTGSTNSSGATTSSGATGAFNIEFSFSGLTAAQQAIFEQAAQKWESIIVGDLPNATYGGRVVDDLLISASATAIDGRGNVLGEAGPDRFRSGSQLPYHGTMQFDTADLASMQADGSLLSVVEHEMGHVLGIGTLWDSKGLLVGAGTSNPRYTGSNAVAEFNRLFATSGTSVPVEATGGAGTRDSHWRDSVFGSELMTGYVGPGTSLPLSRVTVASLADLGYTVNLSAADAFSPPSSSSRLVSGSSGSGGSAASLVAPNVATSPTRRWNDVAALTPRAVDRLFTGRHGTWGW